MTLGSSETTREPPFPSFDSFDFIDFVAHHLPSQKTQVSQAFLEWLLGFLEGDGSFIRRFDPTGRPRLSFEISQKQVGTLMKIRQQLGFGRVRVCQGYGKYLVEDRRGLQRIMALCNGNLVLPKRRQQFADWTAAGQALQPAGWVLRPSTSRVSLETGWLAGFLDAEGCFSALLTKPSHRSRQPLRLTQRVQLVQQDLAGEREVLVTIGQLLGSPAAVRLVKSTGCYRLEMSSLETQARLMAYLDRFPLVEKVLVYRRWCRVYQARVAQAHLSPRGQRKLARLCAALAEARDAPETLIGR